ncbi:MAG: hypothetical protein JWN82_683 [Candidatus Saccharibacteria bacterium]|nr:hypothetical protein [Candidatus Saccharibacteria bacterium]
MNPMEPNQAPEQPVIHNPLSAMRQDEVIIFEVKRHPIGLVFMYLSFGFMLVLIGVIAIMAPDLLSNYDTKLVRQISLITFLVSFVFAAIFTFIGQIVYNGNRWILTNDSLTQVSQRSLFDRQNSQLSLANLEDVTAHQDGILAHMFNFGVLKAETAGERSKFSMLYCPNPNAYAQKILMAREEFEQSGGHMGNSNSGVNANTQ